jgi:predicted acetyltransferase
MIELVKTKKDQISIEKNDKNWVVIINVQQFLTLCAQIEEL